MAAWFDSIDRMQAVRATAKKGPTVDQAVQSASIEWTVRVGWVRGVGRRWMPEGRRTSIPILVHARYWSVCLPKTRV